MKIAFNFKKKEASLQADVEGMIERGMERKEKNPNQPQKEIKRRGSVFKK